MKYLILILIVLTLFTIVEFQFAKQQRAVETILAINRALEYNHAMFWLVARKQGVIESCMFEKNIFEWKHGLAMWSTDSLYLEVIRRKK